MLAHIFYLAKYLCLVNRFYISFKPQSLAGRDRA